MSSYDDWVVNFKVNTKPIEDAIKKVNKLRNEVNSLYSGAPPSQPGKPQIRSQTQRQQLQDSMRALQHNQRLRERYEKAQEREFNAKIRAIRNSQKMQERYTKEQQKLEGMQRKEELRRQTLERNEQLRRREIGQRRDRENYNRQAMNRRDSARMQDRANRLENARANRNYDLDRLDTRARMAGANIDRDQLSALRQRVAGANSFTSLGGLSAEMKAFRDATNAAISRQNALTKQMNQSNFATNAFSNSIKNMAASFVGIYGIIGAAKSLYNNSKEMEAMQIKLLMGTGSKSAAASEYDYIKRKAQETGTSIGSMTNLYSQMAITGKDTGMNQEQLRKVFEATTTMQIGYGMNPEQQKLVTKSIVQMMSFAA